MCLRPARHGDIAAMVAIFKDAFKDNFVVNHCFPLSDNSSDEHLANGIRKNLSDPEGYTMVATQATSTASCDDAIQPILGWACWFRRPTKPNHSANLKPPLTFTQDMFPVTGDPEFAARFYQLNHDAMNRIIQNEPVWYLSSVTVKQELQGRGIGRRLIFFGLENSDKEGWASYLNSAPTTIALYKKYGFCIAATSELGCDTPWYHMKRKLQKPDLDGLDQAILG